MYRPIDDSERPLSRERPLSPLDEPAPHLIYIVKDGDSFCYTLYDFDTGQPADRGHVNI